MFLRHQMSAEFVPSSDDHYRRTGYEVVRAFKPELGGPVPHGRCDDHTWGRDRFGYCDFDDYYLTVYGA